MHEALLLGFGVGVVYMLATAPDALGAIAQHLGQLTVRLAETEDRRRDGKERANWPPPHRAP